MGPTPWRPDPSCLRRDAPPATRAADTANDPAAEVAAGGEQPTREAFDAAVDETGLV